jgi:hypothetical protein
MITDEVFMSAEEIAARNELIRKINRLNDLVDQQIAEVMPKYLARRQRNG